MLNLGFAFIAESKRFDRELAAIDVLVLPQCRKDYRVALHDDVRDGSANNLLVMQDTPPIDAPISTSGKERST